MISVEDVKAALSSNEAGNPVPVLARASEETVGAAISELLCHTPDEARAIVADAILDKLDSLFGFSEQHFFEGCKIGFKNYPVYFVNSLIKHSQRILDSKTRQLNESRANGVLDVISIYQTEIVRNLRLTKPKRYDGPVIIIGFFIPTLLLILNHTLISKRIRSVNLMISVMNSIIDQADRNTWYTTFPMKTGSYILKILALFNINELKEMLGYKYLIQKILNMRPRTICLNEFSNYVSNFRLITDILLYTDRLTDEILRAHMKGLIEEFACILASNIDPYQAESDTLSRLFIAFHFFADYEPLPDNITTFLTKSEHLLPKTVSSNFETDVNQYIKRYLELSKQETSGIDITHQQNVHAHGFELDILLTFQGHGKKFELNVEVDGKAYHSSQIVKTKNTARDKALLKHNINVVRISQKYNMINYHTFRRQFAAAVMAIMPEKPSIQEATSTLTLGDGKTSTPRLRAGGSSSH